MKIDIVIPVCDSWRIPYLENCLNSIRKQTVTEVLERIILAFAPPGYNRSCLSRAHVQDKAAFEKFSSAHRCTFVDGGNDYPLYSLAYSRNIGAKHAKSLILGFIDSDLVLHPKTFETILRYMGPAHAVCVFAARMPFRPDNPIYKDLKNFDKNIPLGKIDTAGKGGGCFFINRSIFENIGGYDERFFGWGYEDVDMLKRLHDSSVMVGNLLSENIFSMHQHHPPSKRWNHEHRTNVNKNLAFSSVSIVRNPNGWGKP